MDADKPSKRHISLKRSKPSDSEDSGVSSIDLKYGKIKSLEDELVTILKIITIASIIDDEYSNDFLSTYENYVGFMKKLSEFDIVENNDIISIENFSKEPVKHWISIVSIVFVALNAIPGNYNISCDVIGNGKTWENTTEEIGACFSTILMIEALDWKEHTIKLFIPFNKESGMVSLFIVDDEVRLFGN